MSREWKREGIKEEIYKRLPQIYPEKELVVVTMDDVVGLVAQVLIHEGVDPDELWDEDLVYLVGEGVDEMVDIDTSSLVVEVVGKDLKRLVGDSTK